MNLNTPAVHEPRKLEAADLHRGSSEVQWTGDDGSDRCADELPTPTRGGRIVGLCILMVSAICVIAGIVHLAARLAS